MVIRCPNCTAFQVDIREATGLFDLSTHCRGCNHDVRISIRPGQPVLVTATHSMSPKRRSRTLADHPALIR